ncbi:MAG: GntR family transcriptional regulator [Gammaproteobacteria bacterium]|nr:GntR family transcriptional regulator [Gammaproteobacteria bacterium]
MVKLGQYSSLSIIKKVDFGVFLNGEELGEILLPKRYLKDDASIGDVISVFLYNDSEDRIVATTETPKALVGECAYLRVVDTNKFGAFLDWGLPKDLLVPFNEQQKPMQKGYSYTVYLFVDETTQRIAASSRLEDHLIADINIYEPRQAVDLQIYGKSDLGFKAVINNIHLGQLYENETFKKLHYGEKLKGYIKLLRTDGKVDLILQLPAHLEREGLADTILQYLEQHQGISTLTDKSPPAEIYATYGVSKATYKKTLGLLYKNRQIKIEKHQISLIDESDKQ